MLQIEEVSGVENSKMTILSEEYTKIVVMDKETGKEIAVITNDLITTANDNIVVKLTPKYN